jgi:hypothetical protein
MQLFLEYINPHRCFPYLELLGKPTTLYPHLICV